jgi:CheY-like chemotaxis protein
MSMKILLVEDSDTDAELIVRQLSKAYPGCLIHRVQTEPHFLVALHDIKPDLILSDLSLPEFDGLRALELTISQTDKTPFILVSGTLSDQRASEAMRHGASDFVPKSKLSDLTSAVERAVSGSSRNLRQKCDREPILIDKCR